MTGLKRILSCKEVIKKYWFILLIQAVGICLSAVHTYPLVIGIPWRYHRYFFALSIGIFPFTVYCMMNVAMFFCLKRSRWAYLWLFPLFLSLLSTLPSNGAAKIARMNHCMDIAKRIHLQCIVYAKESDGWYPPSLEYMLNTKRLTEKDLTCPGNPWHNPGDIDYEYFGAGINWKTQKNNDIIIRDKTTNHPDHSKRIILIHFDGSGEIALKKYIGNSNH